MIKDTLLMKKSILIQIVLGLVLSLISLVIFAYITNDVLRQETMFFDTSLSHAVYAMRTPALTEAMIIISLLGADIALLFAGVITIVLAWRNHKHEAILFVTVLGVGLLLNNVLKFIFQRPRPSIDPILDLSVSYSFPSGHAMNAFIFYLVVAYFVYHFTKNKFLSVIAAILALCLIFLIGFSRVYLGVHYPSDVLAGFIAGFFVFVMAIVLDRSIAFRNMVQVVKKKGKKLSK
jgi:undecaprenyl-diphosphatase